VTTVVVDAVDASGTAGPRRRAGRRRGGRPIDPRLLAYTSGSRRFLGLTVAIGAVTALLVVAQAWCIADTVAGAVASRRTAGELALPLGALLAVVVGRATVGWASERAAQRASTRAKSDLRQALVAKVAALGPVRAAGAGTGEIGVLATSGVDALDAYFSRYLPQVFLAVIVPVTVLAAVVSVDWVSAVIVALTVPLVPVFMALIGSATAERTRRQVDVLQRLAGHFLDVVSGLPTLRVFGRSRAQAAAIREMTDRYRRSTMATLKVAFVSSLVLELLATVSVALVAVAVGLRLLGGHLTLRTALFVLVLAPEAYLPLRQLGANYHASAEGIEAAGRIFDLLDAPVPPRGHRTSVPDPSRVPLTVRGLAVAYPGGGHPAGEGLDLEAEPGETVAIVGPSGCGKSTLLAVLLGFVTPSAGTVRVGDVPLDELDPDAWRRQVAWVPQRPRLFAASVADNVRLGRPDAPTGAVARAVADAGLEAVVGALPRGLDTRLGEGGAGLSAGERQRLALARAFLREAPLLLLDEPTANLDRRTEAAVVAAVGRLARGRTALVVAHRPALLEVADRVVELAPVGSAP
jgi:thiol reductant ABC exporter CydD subunit